MPTPENCQDRHLILQWVGLLQNLPLHLVTFNMEQ